MQPCTAKLAGLGENVAYFEADVTDAAAVAAAVAQVKARFGSIAGAFHLALAMHDARAVTLTPRHRSRACSRRRPTARATS